jgi:hypothetical protein
VPGNGFDETDGVEVGGALDAVENGFEKGSPLAAPSRVASEEHPESQIPTKLIAAKQAMFRPLRETQRDIVFKTPTQNCYSSHFEPFELMWD